MVGAPMTQAHAKADASGVIELRTDRTSMAVRPADGARISSLQVGGRELLLRTPYPADAPEETLWGAFLMAPWVGRLRNGELRWRDRQIRFASNLGRHAIHGLAVFHPWRVTRRGRTTVELELDLQDAGWPFGGRIRQQVSLHPDYVELAAQVESDALPMPIAVGWHPWFLRAGEVELQVPSDQVLELDDEQLPTGATVAVDRVRDLRTLTTLDDRRLDDVYVHATGPCHLRWPDLQMMVEMIGSTRHYVVFTTSSTVCVEPQTAWPDAPTLHERGIPDTGLVTLGPDETFEARTVWRWSRRHG